MPQVHSPRSSTCHLSIHGPAVRSKQRQELVLGGGMHERREAAPLTVTSFRRRSTRSSFAVDVAGFENFLLHRVDHCLQNGRVDVSIDPSELAGIQIRSSQPCSKSGRITATRFNQATSN